MSLFLAVMMVLGAVLAGGATGMLAAHFALKSGAVRVPTPGFSSEHVSVVVRSQLTELRKDLVESFDQRLQEVEQRAVEADIRAGNAHRIASDALKKSRVAEDTAEVIRNRVDRLRDDIVFFTEEAT